ncbi:NYN domain-containing protein [Myxococcota bacterium]|nr:NYN domain-containing protein [Myxococcota bacterium]
MVQEGLHTVPPHPTPEVWLVDGYNVLHAVVLGDDRERWWREEQRDRLIRMATDLGAGEAPVWVVFDGPHPLADTPESFERAFEDCPAPLQESRVGVVFAPDADDWILTRARRASSPEGIAVVTADRRLAARVRRTGVQVVSPRSFLDACRAAGTDPPTGNN